MADDELRALRRQMQDQYYSQSFPNRNRNRPAYAPPPAERRPLTGSQSTSSSSAPAASRVSRSSPPQQPAHSNPNPIDDFEYARRLQEEEERQLRHNPSSSSSPPRHRRRREQEDEDMELARRLQAEEDARNRPSRPAQPLPRPTEPHSAASLSSVLDRINDLHQRMGGYSSNPLVPRAAYGPRIPSRGRSDIIDVDEDDELETFHPAFARHHRPEFMIPPHVAAMMAGGPPMPFGFPLGMMGMIAPGGRGGGRGGEMSYDEMMRISEMLGEVKSRGASEDKINSSTLSFTLNAEEIAKLPEGEKACPICLCDFQVKEDLRRMSCMHAFHAECAVSWLKNNATCPVCRKQME